MYTYACKDLMIESGLIETALKFYIHKHTRERERERERELTAFPNPWRNVENSLEVVAVVGASGRVF